MPKENTRVGSAINFGRELCWLMKALPLFMLQYIDMPWTADVWRRRCSRQHLHPSSSSWRSWSWTGTSFHLRGGGAGFHAPRRRCQVLFVMPLPRPPVTSLRRGLGRGLQGKTTQLTTRGEICGACGRQTKYRPSRPATWTTITFRLKSQEHSFVDIPHDVNYIRDRKSRGGGREQTKYTYIYAREMLN